MISVVIPLYNKALSIKKAVDSVLKQTINDWELIVIDDGSDDQGAELVMAYNDCRIQVVKQANSGVAVARNNGVMLAKNEIVAFLDADDFWEPYHLANLSKLVCEFPRVSLYGTAYFAVGGDGVANMAKCPGAAKGETRVLIKDYFSTVVNYGYFIFTSSIGVKKSALISIGGFPDGIKSGEDTLTWAKLACHGGVAYSRSPTSYYTLPAVNAKIRKSIVRRPPIPDFVGHELAILKDAFPELEITLYLGFWHRIRAMLFLELNERLNSLKEIGVAIKYSGIYFKDIVCVALLLFPPKVRPKLLAYIRKLRGRA